MKEKTLVKDEPKIKEEKEKKDKKDIKYSKDKKDIEGGKDKKIKKEKKSIRAFPEFLVKNRKSVIVVCCVMIICCAVYVDWRVRTNSADSENYIYTSELSESTKILGEAKLVDSPNVENGAQALKDEYFVNAVLNRKRSRDESVDMLQTVVDSSETMPDVKDKALQEMFSIAGDIAKEASIEELIKAKGFEDCIAVISGDNINVVVKTQGLLTNEVAQIQEIVMNEADFAPENIKIVEKY